MHVTLDDVVERGMLSALRASFLRAAVRARKSIVVDGCQGAGKTTLVRALCCEIDEHEAIGTFETRSEEHTSELQSLMRSSYAVLCLKNKNRTDCRTTIANPDCRLHCIIGTLHSSLSK